MEVWIIKKLISHFYMVKCEINIVPDWLITVWHSLRDTKTCLLRRVILPHSDIMSKRIRCTRLVSSLHLSSSSPVEHKATTMFCHKVLSLAEAWASPLDSPFSFSSAIIVCRHVIFGRPRFLFLGGVHLRATLGLPSLDILRTCPSQLSHRRLVSRTALLQPVFL